MRIQCPTCNSFNDQGATFCSQCGKIVDESGRWRRMRPSLGWLRLFVGMVLLLLAGVIYCIVSLRESDRASETVVATSPVVDTAIVTEPEEEEVPQAEEIASSPETDEDTPLTPDARRKIAQASLVVVGLQNAEERPIRDIRGVIVHPDGVVLCRFRPLLGAYRGTCRLSNPGGTRFEVLGVTYYDERRDFALLRVDAGEVELSPVTLPDETPDVLFESGDDLNVFSGYRLKLAAVSEASYMTAEGVVGLRFAAEPRVVPETFMAIDFYGYLVGLCRPLVNGRFPAEREVVKDDNYRMFVDPAYDLRREVELPVALTLFQLTSELYEGTFPDLVARGEQDFRRKSWTEAIEYFLRAVQRAEIDAVEESLVAEVYAKLRESYLQEIQRLQAGERHAEGAVLAEVALQYLPRDVTVWSELADSRFALGLLRDGIDALLEVKALDTNGQVEQRLEKAYLRLASESLAADNSRDTETAYIEGIEELPRSGRLHMGLAKLYQEWEAFDDAIRLFRVARELDRSLADQIDNYLDRIDDILKRRDAVVIRIPENSKLINTTVELDGGWNFPFIVDTGATHTTVPNRFVDEMGYNIQRSQPVKLSTAGGTVWGRKIRLHSVSLQGYSVRNLDVLVLPDKIGLKSGLLGQNFLRHFKYEVNVGRGEFRLERP